MNKKRAPQSKSSRAGLQFPVGRIHRFLKENINSRDRVGVTAAVTPTLSLELLQQYILLH